MDIFYHIKIQQKTLKSNKRMFLLDTNISLASFQLPSISLLYLDPYNNTFGEKDWLIVFCTTILCILSIVLIYLILGIVMFVKYGIDTENRKLLDELISFWMIMCIIMLLPTTILTTYRNIFGPLPSIFGTQILLSVLKFAQISTVMIGLEGSLVWYIGEMVYENQYEMDEIGMAECLKFFTVTLSSGMTILVSSVGEQYHEDLLSFVGLPLDFSEKYLVNLK